MGLLARLGKRLNILGSSSPEPVRRPVARPVAPDPEPESLRAPGESASAFVARIVSEKPVVLFMKGTPDQPRCGFSASAVASLRGAGAQVYGVDVLADEEIRAAVKDFSSWPTLPQAYIAGEFIGGSDIVAELAASGELASKIAGSR